MNQLPAGRPTWAEISLGALRENYLTLKGRLDPGAQLMAVVKADAYGHGSVACARALESAGAAWFAVALVEEGIELRRGGIGQSVFCLGGFWRGQAGEVIRHDLIPAIFRLDAAEELDVEARLAGRIARYHLKIDTGMGRLGVPVDDIIEFAAALGKFRHLQCDGVMTHLADADGDNAEYTEAQISGFQRAVAALNELGMQVAWRHLSNSAGIFGYPHAHGNMARAGATLYGLSRDVIGPRAGSLPLRPVMSLHSRIIFIKTVPAGTAIGYGRTFVTARESRIATIPIGYADGLRRAHSNRGRVLTRGCFAPIIGRVSMDLTMIDVTDIRDAGIGDEVVILGSNGDHRILAEDLAAEIGTISYEIVTGISNRVPRLFVE